MDDIAEYAHGGTAPLRIIADPYGYPTGCSVDNTTGKLAVANFLSPSIAPLGNLAVYAPPYTAGTTEYTDVNQNLREYCGYDNRGTFTSRVKRSLEHINFPSFRTAAVA
jgi:hypothetical protein